MDDVWPLVYSEKGRAVKELKKNFLEGDDYLSFDQKVKREIGAATIVKYKLSVPCLEYFIAKKVRPLFDVYQCLAKNGESKASTRGGDRRC